MNDLPTTGLRPTPPQAARQAVRVERHGRVLADFYGWLRDPDWQRVMREPSALQPTIRAHLEAENAYAAAVLAPTEALQRTLFQEMRARIKDDDASVPAPDGPWAYFERFAPGAQHPLWCRQGREDPATEQVLLDGEAAAKGEAFFRVAEALHSPDHRLFAWAVDLNGSEFYTIRIRDLDTGAMLPDALADAHGDFVWAKDGRTLFYTVLDANHRPFRVMRHHIGTPAEDDHVVFEETDPGFFLGVAISESRRFVIIASHDHADTAEVHLIDAERPDAPAELVARRRTGLRYAVSDHGDRFFVLTNADEAVDFKIMEAPLTWPSRETWQELVPHRPGRLIRSMLVFRDWLVRLERAEGISAIVVRGIADGAEHSIAFDEDSYTLALSPGYEFATDILRFTYSSPTTPQRTFDYDMRTRQRTLLKEQAVPSGHDPAQYICRRLFADAADGARVPITVLHRRDVPVDGSAPMLLYGYGAYGLAIPPSFNANVLSLVDRGFVYAIAHVRGGTDMGYRWYLDGKLLKKRNTFTDFIVAAETLIADRYSARGRIVAMGRSAGGMLMGAIANMRPELFRAVVAEVPFVDVLNTMTDAGLPLTPPEWVEWGDPVSNEAAFDYIAGYCPYTNVTRQRYPDVLATGGLTDPRVTYWEPAKWVAKLREYDIGGGARILLRLEMDAGHMGAPGRFDRLHEVARSYAFAIASVEGRLG
jgi:oligopeptidase B